MSIPFILSCIALLFFISGIIWPNQVFPCVGGIILSVAMLISGKVP